MRSRADLHEYQRRAIAMMLEQPKVYLAIGMGLGKTVSALTAVADLKAQGEPVKVLVIAPKKVAESVWPNEPGEWQHLSGLSISLVTGSVSERALALTKKADVYVVGRDNVAWLVDHLKTWSFSLLIIDEASSFKNPSSKRFKALRRVRALVERCWMLSGTPAPNGLLDLWPQYFILDGGQRLGRTFSAYRSAYFTSDYMGFKWNLQPGCEALIHQKIADITVSMKAEDYLTMPDRIDTKVQVLIDREVREAYRTLERDYLIQHRGQTVTAANAAVLAGKLLQLANGAIYDEERNPVEVHGSKLAALDEVVEGMNGNPVLVFYLFKHDLARIRRAYPKSRELKTAQDVSDWNAGKIEILLAHPASCGHGLNLQGAHGSAAVWFGMPWSLELYQQANARIHRQGVKHTVVIHHLLVRDSIDEDVMGVVGDKAVSQDKLLEALKRRAA
jgi:SNF2 family DNA or RNA helicase